MYAGGFATGCVWSCRITFVSHAGEAVAESGAAGLPPHPVDSTRIRRVVARDMAGPLEQQDNATRTSPTAFAACRRSLVHDCCTSENDVSIQAMLTLNALKAPDLAKVVAAHAGTAASHRRRGCDLQVSLLHAAATASEVTREHRPVGRLGIEPGTRSSACAPFARRCRSLAFCPASIQEILEEVREGRHRP
jgi:hypothetical protein